MKIIIRISALFLVICLFIVALPVQASSENLSDMYEVDNTSKQANPMSNGELQTHNFSSLDDQDWITFSLDHESSVLIRTSHESQTTNTKLWLFDNQLNEIGFNDDVEPNVNLFSQLEYSCIEYPLEAGTYYVKLLGDNETDLAEYNIEFSASACEYLSTGELVIKETEENEPQTTPEPEDQLSGDSLSLPTVSPSPQFSDEPENEDDGISHPMIWGLETGTYDDSDPGVTYIGTWPVTMDSQAYQESYHYSIDLTNAIEVKFLDTRISFLYTSTEDSGSVQIYIDAVLLETLDQSSISGTIYQQEWKSEEYSYGGHILQIVHDSGGSVSFDGFTIGDELDPPSLVSPSSNAVLYDCQSEFSWSNVTNASHYEINILHYGSNGTNINSTPDSTSFIPSTVMRPDIYFWQVRSWNNSLSSDWSSVNWFTINIGAPNNVTPVTNDGTYSLTPTFDWSDVCGADGYDLYAVRFDETGTPQTAIYTGTTASEYTPPSNLTPGIFAWYVRAKSGTSYGPWNTFYWLVLFIGAPNLQTPVTNDLVTPYPDFSWTTVAGATAYDLFVVKIEGGGHTTAIYEEYIPTTSYTDTDPLESGIYAWYVRARAGHWVGPWTNFYWFVVP